MRQLFSGSRGSFHLAFSVLTGLVVRASLLDSTLASFPPLLACPASRRAVLLRPCATLMHAFDVAALARAHVDSTVRRVKYFVHCYDGDYNMYRRAIFTALDLNSHDSLDIYEQRGPSNLYSEVYRVHSIENCSAVGKHLSQICVSEFFG